RDAPRRAARAPRERSRPSSRWGSEPCTGRSWAPLSMGGRPESSYPTPTELLVEKGRARKVAEVRRVLLIDEVLDGRRPVVAYVPRMTGRPLFGRRAAHFDLRQRLDLPPQDTILNRGRGVSIAQDRRNAAARRHMARALQLTAVRQAPGMLLRE